MIYGWADTILRVDLTREKIIKQPFPKSLGVKFIGGAGVNAKILYDEVGREVRPFDPENRLIFGTGPLVGTLAPASNRTTITNKGPFTFAFSDSNGGGDFAPELKWAGYEHMIIQGKAKELVYLWIDDDYVELRNAKHLRGRDVLETDEIIKEDVKDAEIHTAIIGEAGEECVRYAIPMLDLWRAPGWGGAGAIMGSKNLKAVAVRGTKGLKVAKLREFEKACQKIREMMIEAPRTPILRYSGRAHNEDCLQEFGVSGVKNWSEVFPPEGEPSILSETIVREVWAEAPNRGCFNCPVNCTHRFLVKDGPYVGIHGEKIEFNQVSSVKLMGIYNPKFVAKWTFETNRHGLDTDTTAHSIGWAMECYENGILTERDSEGLQVTFGNEEVALKLVEMIAHREGKLGDLLAEGPQLAARKLGKGSEKYAMVIKGARLGALDPRLGYGTALSHAVATRGGDHLKGFPCIELYPFDEETKWKVGTELFGHPKAVDRYSPEGKGYLVKWYEDHCAVTDALGICKTQTRYISLSLPSFQEFADLLSPLTGIKFTAIDLMKAGERIITLERCFNAKCGLTRNDDTLPERFFTEPIPTAHLQMINKEAFEKMKDEYYELRGCDIKTGTPTKKKLKELELEDVADDLERSGVLTKPGVT